MMLMVVIMMMTVVVVMMTVIIIVIVYVAVLIGVRMECTLADRGTRWTGVNLVQIRRLILFASAQTITGIDIDRFLRQVIATSGTRSSQTASVVRHLTNTYRGPRRV